MGTLRYTPLAMEATTGECFTIMVKNAVSDAEVKPGDEAVVVMVAVAVQ